MIKRCRGARGFSGRECLALFTGLWGSRYCGPCQRRIRAANWADAVGHFEDGSPNPGVAQFASLHRWSAEAKKVRPV